MISFEGQLTFADFGRIQRFTSPRWVTLLPWLILGALPLLLLTGGLRVILADPADQLPRLVLGLAVAAFLFVMPRRAIRKAWDSSANIRAPFSGSLSDEGIVWRGAMVQGHFQWSDLHGYRAAPDLLVIYTSNNQAVWLIPRFFTRPEEWRSAVTLVAKHLRKR